MRKLVNESNVFSQQNFRFNKESANDPKSVDAVSNLVEYYHADNNEVEGKEQMDLNASGSKTINDIIFSLLLIGKHHMHMNINSDYEMK